MACSHPIGKRIRFGRYNQGSFCSFFVSSIAITFIDLQTKDTGANLLLKFILVDIPKVLVPFSLRKGKYTSN